jgi:hypothetical protein
MTPQFKLEDTVKVKPGVFEDDFNLKYAMPISIIFI